MTAEGKDKVSISKLKAIADGHFAVLGIHAG